MDIYNCAKCGRLFYNISEDAICPDCRKIAEDKIHEVEIYIEENRDAGIEQVAKACDVDPDQIERWIKGERLKYSINASHKIACEGCGEMIHSGKLCEKCRKKKVELIQKLSSEIAGGDGN